MSSMFSSKANAQVMAIALVVILLGAVVLVAWGPWREAEAVDNCPKGLPWEEFTEEQKAELPECEGRQGDGDDCERDITKCDLPEPEVLAAELKGLANWVIVTTYVDGDIDVEELGEFELSPGAVIGGPSQKEVLSWDIVLKYDVGGYAVQGVRIENARMSFDSDVPSGDFDLDAGFKNVPLTGPILVFNGIDEPTISLDAFEDVEKPIVDSLCAGGKIKGLVERDCEIKGQLTVGAQLVIDITDTKDELVTLRADFGTITQKITVIDDREQKVPKPDWNYVCDYAGKYGPVPEGPYANQYKVNKNEPFQSVLHQAVSLSCAKPAQQCSAAANEVWNKDTQKCEKLVCEDVHERATNGRCVKIICPAGYILWAGYSLCYPLGETPRETQCPQGQVPAQGEVGWYCKDIPAAGPTPEERCIANGHIWTGAYCVEPPSNCRYGIAYDGTCAEGPPEPQCANGFTLIGGSCMFECEAGAWTISPDSCPSVPNPPSCDPTDYSCGGWVVDDPPKPPEPEERCTGYECVDSQEAGEAAYGLDDLEEVTYCADTECSIVGVTIVENGEAIEQGHEQHRTEVQVNSVDAINSPAVVNQGGDTRWRESEY